MVVTTGVTQDVVSKCQAKDRLRNVGTRTSSQITGSITSTHSTERGVACTPLKVTASPVTDVTRDQGQPGLWGIELQGSALGQAFKGGPCDPPPYLALECQGAGTLSLGCPPITETSQLRGGGCPVKSWRRQGSL